MQEMQRSDDGHMTAQLRAEARSRTSVAGLVASALSLALAPIVLADSYDWVRHTTSEAGGQGVRGAWLARAGFVLFGLSVLLMAETVRTRWQPTATACHRFFAVAMVAVAAFSLRSREDGVPSAEFNRRVLRPVPRGRTRGTQRRTSPAVARLGAAVHDLTNRQRDQRVGLIRDGEHHVPFGDQSCVIITGRHDQRRHTQTFHSFGGPAHERRDRTRDLPDRGHPGRPLTLSRCVRSVETPRRRRASCGRWRRRSRSCGRAAVRA